MIWVRINEDGTPAELRTGAKPGEEWIAAPLGRRLTEVSTMMIAEGKWQHQPADMLAARQKGLERTEADIAAARVAAMKEARRRAFAAEADPLFFKVKRGEASEDEYMAKVAEIRARYPYPSEVKE